MTVLWLLATVGVLSGATWLATVVGVVQPYIVISGSMAPTIHTGDLIVSVPTGIGDIAPGDVVTLGSRMTGGDVTHRVVTITEPSVDGYSLALKGDANDSVDAETYQVAAGRSVPKLAVVLPQVGRYAEAISRPPVALSLLVAFSALIGLAALPARSPADDAGEASTVDEQTATRRR